ncbi:hypothetical protein Agub_g2289, partial [Astrephomene gubernaculifera]
SIESRRINRMLAVLRPTLIPLMPGLPTGLPRLGGERRRRLYVEAKKGANRGKSVAKENLPNKICATCGLPFTWRKKWKDVWEEVRYCSERCRGNRGKRTDVGNTEAPASE